jgi:hypothetical protein
MASSRCIHRCREGVGGLLITREPRSKARRPQPASRSILVEAQRYDGSDDTSSIARAARSTCAARESMERPTVGRATRSPRHRRHSRRGIDMQLTTQPRTRLQAVPFPRTTMSHMRPSRSSSPGDTPRSHYVARDCHPRRLSVIRALVPAHMDSVTTTSSNSRLDIMARHHRRVRIERYSPDRRVYPGLSTFRFAISYDSEQLISDEQRRATLR